jgi:hypothetical protein
MVAGRGMKKLHHGAASNVLVGIGFGLCINDAECAP